MSCLSYFQLRFRKVQGISENVINSGIVMSQAVSNSIWMIYCITSGREIAKKEIFSTRISTWLNQKKSLRNFFFFASECFGRDQADIQQHSWISFYILQQPKRARLSHFPISLPLFSCVATVSHTFLLSEWSERVTKLLNTLKYSERFQRSVGVRRSTWRDWKAVGSRLIGWILFFFSLVWRKRLQKKRQKISKRLSCAKNIYKRIKCWCLVCKKRTQPKKKSFTSK